MPPTNPKSNSAGSDGEGDFRVVAWEPSMREGVIAVVRGVHDEYGFTWDEHGYHRDLYEVEEQYVRPGGMFSALLLGDRVVGCVGVTLHGPECELHRLYLSAELRGRGWGGRLLRLAQSFGREKGCRKMIAWSDVKLANAHSMYLRAGFVQEGERICEDPDKSREYGFWKEPL